jgi:S-adenosylmethionine synthetase
MSMTDFLFTSESVTEGHPDKVCDQISDAILDAIIKDDPGCRVACETMATTGLVVIAGEITTNVYVEIPEVARAVVKDIGYDSSDMGFDWESCGVLTSIHKQSPDIAMGVDPGGAGDQGLMFGYACTDTDVLMPMPIVYAHMLTKKLTQVRKDNTLDFLRPDGKTQVSI